jgi:hypothetical protein
LLIGCNIKHLRLYLFNKDRSVRKGQNMLAMMNTAESVNFINIGVPITCVFSVVTI